MRISAAVVPFQNNGKCRFFDALRLLRMTDMWRVDSVGPNREMRLNQNEPQPLRIAARFAGRIFG
jgi:hypothetical protein